MGVVGCMGFGEEAARLPALNEALEAILEARNPKY
jgi:hypothetical protein